MLIAYNIFSSLIAAYIYLALTKVIFNGRYDKKTVIYFIVSLGLVTSIFTIMQQTFGPEIKTVVNLAAYIILSRIFLKLKIVKSIIATIIYIITYVAGNFIVILAVVKAIGVSLDTITKSLLLTFMTDFIIYSLIILIIYIIDFLKISKDIQDKYREKTNRRTIIYMISTLVIITVNYFTIVRFINVIGTNFIILNVTITFVYLAVSIYINYTNNELALKEQEYDHQQDYIRTIDQLIDDYRRLKHNNNNVIYSIYGYIQENDFKGLKEYFTEIIDGTKRLGNDSLLALQKIKIYALFGLVWAKLNNAQEMGIYASVAVTDEIKEVKMKLSDLTEVLGNYLDNAIDAAQGSTIKKIIITIKEDGDYLAISVANSCDEEPNFNKIYEKGFSTKGENRGHGLVITQNILSNYKNVLHNNYFIDGYFVQELVIKNK